MENGNKKMSSPPFNPEGKIIVVTGGASGIGAALCLAFARANALAIVVADVNVAGGERVCGECTRLFDAASLDNRSDGARNADGADGEAKLHQRACAVLCDASKEKDISSLIHTVESSIGEIDMFVANAGIYVGPTTSLSDVFEEGAIPGEGPVWDGVLGVNVMQHVYVARHLMPLYARRKRGHMLVTASAAGLLVAPGSITYSVSKAAAVAVAEYLSITYGSVSLDGRGIGVSCLCPEAVRTAMTMRHTGRDSPIARAAAVNAILEADEVADHCLKMLHLGHFLILPHKKVDTYVRRKADDRDRWIIGMRRLQDKLSKQRVDSPPLQIHSKL